MLLTCWNCSYQRIKWRADQVLRSVWTLVLYLFGREAHKTFFNMTPLSWLPLITIGLGTYKICMHVLFDPLVCHRIQGSSFTWENNFDYLKRYFKIIPHSATHISILIMPLQLHFLYVFTRPPPTPPRLASSCHKQIHCGPCMCYIF